MKKKYSKAKSPSPGELFLVAAATLLMVGLAAYSIGYKRGTNLLLSGASDTLTLSKYRGRLYPLGTRVQFAPSGLFNCEGTVENFGSAVLLGSEIQTYEVRFECKGGHSTYTDSFAEEDLREAK